MPWTMTTGGPVPASTATWRRGGLRAASRSRSHPMRPGYRATILRISGSRVPEIFLVLVLRVDCVAVRLCPFDIGIRLHLVDLVGDTLLGVIHPLADLLAGCFGGVLGVVHESHDCS